MRVLSIFIICLFLMACKLESKESSQAIESLLSSPTVSIDTESLEGITATNAAHFMISGGCSEEGQPIIVVVGGLSPTTAPNCSNGTWETIVDLIELRGASRAVLITADHSTSKGLTASPAIENILLHPTLSINRESLENITATNAANFIVSGGCSEQGQPITVVVGEGEGGLSPTTAPNCSHGVWTTTINMSGLTGASRPITITADYSTSEGLAASQVRGSVLLHPRVSIDIEALEDITASNAAHFVVSGRCSEEGQPITVVVGEGEGGLSSTTSPNCFNETWITIIDMSGLTGASRPITMTADHWTSEGLAASQAIENVLLRPRVSINIGALESITASNAAHFIVSGSCSEEGQPITVRVGGLSSTTAPNCSHGVWTTAIDVTHLNGVARTILITADHWTSEGLAASQAIENVPLHPGVSIDIEALESITATNAASFRVSGSCLSEGEPISVKVEEVSPTTAPNCTNGAWEVNFDVTGLNKVVGDIEITADHSPSVGDAFPQDTATVTNHFICPQNYVGVPKLSGYTTKSFCVMKYEAKSGGSDNAVSKASGRPYVSINRAHSIGKCTGIGEGYDLITNDEWQSLSRNIELVSDNWSTGVVGNAGGLSRGHSDGAPNSALVANSDDTEGCHGTGQICSNSIWDSQRRTHTLSNGEVIWDIAGNVWEWVKAHNEFKYGSNAYFSQVTEGSHSTSNSLSNGVTTTSRIAKAQFGPSGDYTSLSTSPYGNLGYGYLNYNRGGVFRGGYLNNGSGAGVFAVDLGVMPLITDTSLGFRCVFHP